MVASQFLVVGLGNLPYPLTRHSVGHLILDSLAFRLGVSFASERVGYIARTNVAIGENSAALTLFKPKTLMNISGRPVVTALRDTVSSPSQMIVVHDELSRKPSTLSPKFGGSANGHNGCGVSLLLWAVPWISIG
ncbi:putative peptidyl-tRNA hydrolase [Grifola frondosa]|uniref:Putative peptidyl-tRNA hydrolase n=1 Tax=Grifola frondosa TaxID=5627 RepID=A0A1C7M260_GRIFR|nr:putative peptidyl-tRNA hydrolase [Grifola frondosa]